MTRPSRRRRFLNSAGLLVTLGAGMSIGGVAFGASTSSPAPVPSRSVAPAPTGEPLWEPTEEPTADSASLPTEEPTAAAETAAVRRTRPVVAATEPAAPMKVMPLGDSITMGIGSATMSSYRTDLYQRLTAAGVAVDFVGSAHNGVGPDTDHEGHSGWTIAKIASKADEWLSTYQPDVVLLHIGTNDIRTDAGAVGAPARLSALIDQLLADRPGSEFFVATIVGAKEAAEQRRIDTYNHGVRTVVATKGAHVHLVEQSTVDELDIRDNLHPNDFGLAKMSWNFYTAMRTAFAASWPLTDNPYEADQAKLCLLKATYPNGRYQPVIECRQWYRRAVGGWLRWQTPRTVTERYPATVRGKKVMKTRSVVRWSNV